MLRGGARLIACALLGCAAPAPAGRADPGPDRGIGVVAFIHPPGAGVARTDTLLVRAAPSRDARAVARFLQLGDGRGAWEYRLEAEGAAEGGGLEFAYEEQGLPIDRLTPDSAWARVRYGADERGAPLYGWIHLDPAAARHLVWRDHLPEQTLYLLRPDGRSFRDAPAGRPLGVRLAPAAEGEPDYDLVPLRVVGEWMEVRVEVPAACSPAREGAPVPGRVAWVRYLDGGRPLVWYHTRGC